MNEHVHSASCAWGAEQITDDLLFVQGVGEGKWLKVVHRGTGGEVMTLIAIPIVGILMTPDGEQGTMEFSVVLPPDAGKAIVEGIASLIREGEPPRFQMPGTN